MSFVTSSCMAFEAASHSHLHPIRFSAAILGFKQSMTRIAESKAVRKRKDLQEKERRILAAVEAYQLEQAKPLQLRKGVNRLAAELGVNGKTVLNRYNGMQSMSEANAKKQQLLPAQEKHLADLIAVSSDQGRPFTKKDIVLHGNRILNQTSCETDIPKLGKKWARNFVARHDDELQMYRSKHLDSQRAKCMNPSAVEGWFDLLEEYVVKEEVEPKNILAMDETGFIPSNEDSEQVVGRKGKKVQHRVGTANRETTTVLVTICADGTHLAPSIIYKGEHLYAKWTKNNVAEARYENHIGNVSM